MLWATLFLGPHLLNKDPNVRVFTCKEIDFKRYTIIYILFIYIFILYYIYIYVYIYIYYIIYIFIDIYIYLYIFYNNIYREMGMYILNSRTQCRSA